MTDERREDPIDPHREGFEALQAAILDRDAVMPPGVRRRIAERRDVPERFAAYVDAVHDRAYQVTDRTVTDLRAAGASEDEVFETTVAAAFGAARDRLEAGLGALRSVTEAP